MAFRRSAVRSRLAPPPHHRGRAAHAAAAPLILLLRGLLALALLGLLPGSAPQIDPALALARAAGALCLADGPDGLPSDHAHEHCLACPAAPAAGGLAEAPRLPLPRQGAAAPQAIPGRAILAERWAAYSSRAPPGAAA